ncbi:hypothetical protein BS47DRAFT_727706 [Hydnum rufescens UP504]|uniref:UBA domain-containing protein n=1 Tax=Hydnum rufescens UP504 TaxID=1448309 RepID=A0A9P6DZE3_9AGAM|nr:hypothetical protein BS47DRAFT_727706 [Hydnum rufescens UP504]
MTAGYTTKEDEAVQALADIGIQASEKKIRDTLRKHNGDLDATASALMSELDDPQLDDIPPLEEFAGQDTDAFFLECTKFKNSLASCSSLRSPTPYSTGLSTTS